MTSRYFDPSSRNRKWSVRAVGQTNNITVEMQSLVFRTGDEPHEISFFVPFDGKITSSNLPFRYGNNYVSAETIEIQLFDASNTYHTSFWFKVVSANQATLGNRRGISYRAKDPLNLWAKTQPIYKEYNQIDKRDFFDQHRSEMGFSWTDDSGDVRYELFSKSNDNWLGLIDAYHAIMDIFYTPKRRAKIVKGSISEYPRLVFDPEVKRLLEDFILPNSPYKPSSVMSAIMDILQRISSRLIVLSICNGPSLNNQTLLVTKIGKGPRIDGLANNTGMNLQDFAYHNHSPRENKIVITRDESSVNTENQIDALVYKGGVREYFVRNAPLIPAWDWWNDYRVVVRSSNTLKRIPMILPSGLVNPEYPSFIIPIVQQYEKDMVEDISLTMADLSNPDAPTNRLYILGKVTWLWQQILAQWSNLPSSLTGNYMINICAQDYYIKPDDQYHKYRFKRFIAIPPSENNSRFIPYIDPKNGWEHPDINRFRNIMPSLIDGKRQDISAKYLTERLKRTDTYHLNISTLVEAEMPNYSEFDGQGFGKRETPYGSTVDSALPLEWRQIESVQVDGEHGFIMIGEPQNQSLYIDRGTLLAAAPINGQYSFTSYQGDNAQPGQPSSPEEDRRAAAFQSPVMKSGGISGTELELDYIPFRARMRATFYFQKEQSHRGITISNNDPTQTKTNYDIPKRDVSRNDVWLSGIVIPKDINPNARYVDFGSPNCRLGFFEDNNMIWQTPLMITDPSIGGNVEIGSEFDSNNRGILQSQIYTKDSEAGKVYIILQWKHRDDRNLLLKKAKMYLSERMNPQYGGVIETLEMIDFMLSSHILGGGSSYGLGHIAYDGKEFPISGFNYSFPDFKVTVEFDLRPIRFGLPYEPDRVQKIIAAESFRRLNEKNGKVDPKMMIRDGVNRPHRKGSESYLGYRVPWEGQRPDMFNRMPGAGYGRVMKNIPAGSANDAIIGTIYSLTKALLPSDQVARSQAVLSIFSKMPEMRDKTMVTRSYNKDGEE